MANHVFLVAYCFLAGLFMAFLVVMSVRKGVTFGRFGWRLSRSENPTYYWFVVGFYACLGISLFAFAIFMLVTGRESFPLLDQLLSYWDRVGRFVGSAPRN